MDDRISTLTDDLLCRILSFLPTEQAVATSILSKRWKPIWISVPVLDFDNQTHLRKGKPSYSFERLIYATIQARDPQQSIKTFRLKYELLDLELSEERANADINVWIKTAINHGVENLEIYLDCNSVPFDYIVRLTCCGIFSCKTLVVLKLKEVSLAASGSVELPSLKCLWLLRVEFEEPQYLMELLYGCPELEDLKTIFLDYAHGGSFCKERFKILPKLVRADIRSSGMEIMDGNSTSILMKAISNVEFMNITEFRVNDSVPEFPHLRHLTLSLISTVKSSNLMLLMLKNCPKVQSFELFGSFKDDDVLHYPHFVPECLTSCLTKCYLKRFEGTENDLQFAKYIMQNSTYLQSMKILSLSPDPLEVLKELAMYPRKSASCELSFDR
ncbi:F-box/FBD/LRR-repeat protein At4g26340-like [Lotus japonicus]|uniref:F-box/FBD/LRR-repeat protein At4g26340-like n=1 Tax=Lotus japonicus TaxID=34305 RepID=UPI002589FB20|nr:F-box/FBD/LRR-repeat protein At4g26340-like [Lotus japonicus]XP_057426369.1 F-box/FBD/LRR-repeat protein At4g26340-like [Lotus japonicus]XP_057426374.1 F-box/FBD/LRR-repeat protein At4g26340-like [Lotus japonicus]